MKQESLKLTSIIKEQPDLVDSLAQVIIASVSKKHPMLTPDDEPVEYAGKAGAKFF